jgi:formylglycine-generating enzyme required for sulfatase activity
MVRIESGSFQSLDQPAVVKIRSFAMDTIAVSQEAFLAFTKRSAQLRAADLPATNLTWSEADAYCRARGARLPTTNEWEYVARASERQRDASADPRFKQRVLELAINGRRDQLKLGGGFRNVWGVRGLHGGPFEWTQDFQAAMKHGHGAHAGHNDHTISCASGTVTGVDASDYAAFLRYSFRKTADARKSSPNVGFRCAMSL